MTIKARDQGSSDDVCFWRLQERTVVTYQEIQQLSLEQERIKENVSQAETLLLESAPSV